jgi:cation transport protein ChaC
VFGYGSLMWQPGFDFIAQFPARLIGEHRALCIYSHIHRGTPERPGLVLGLDRGGACQGTVFQVAAGKSEETLAYLRSREQKTGVYREVLRSVWIEGDARRRVQALTYVVDRSHPQYAGALTLEQQLHFVAHSRGVSGANRDYVISTVKALEARGCRDATLHNLVARLQGDTPLHRA